MTRTIFRSFFRLSLRSPWLWGVTGICFVLIFLRSWTGIAGAAGFAYLFGGEGLIMAIFFLGQMLATVEDAYRSRGEAIREPLESLPYHPAAWVVGRLLAQYFSWLAAGTLLWLAGVAMIARPWQYAPEPFLLAGWLRLLPVTLLFTVGASQAVGSLIRTRFGGLVVTFLLYLSGRFLSAALGVLLHTAPFTALDLDLATYFPLGPMGAFPDSTLLMLNRLFAAGLGIGLTALMAWQLARRRAQPARWAAGIAILAVMAAAAAAATAQTVSGRRIDAALAAMAAYEQAGEVPPDPAAQVRGYDIALDLQPAAHRLAAEAKVDLEGGDPAVVLTLRRDFTVRDILGPDGNPVGFSRTGDDLILSTAGQAGRYRIRYDGEVMEWRLQGSPKLAAHVTNQSVMLPAGFGWYPLPGHQQLADLVTARGNLHLADKGVRHPPVPFRLTVAGVADLNLVTNVESDRPVGAAWIIATPFAGASSAGVRVYVSPGNRQSAGRLLEAYAPEAAFYEEAVPLAGPRWLVEVPDSLAGVTNAHDAIGGYPGAVLLADSEFGIVWDGAWIHVLRGKLSGWWWGEARSAEERGVQMVLATFMAELYGQANPGAGGPPLFLGADSSALLGPDGRSALSALWQYEEQHGLAGASQLLRSLHDSSLPLSWRSLSEAMQKGGR